MDKLLLRVFASTLRGNGSIGPFDNLQQRLLHAFTRNIASDRKVLCLFRNLINLIDVDNANLSTGNIKIRSRNKLQQDVLNVFAYITRFGQRGSIGNRERNLQRTRKRFGQKRLTRTRGTQQQDIAFRQLYIVFIGNLFHANALVVVIHGNRKRFFRIFLPYHVLGQATIKLLRRREILQRSLFGILFATMLLFARIEEIILAISHEIHLAALSNNGSSANGNAFIADIDAIRPGDHGVCHGCGLAAERAARLIRIITVSRHIPYSSSSEVCP